MSLSESRRRANDKWDKENMATLACKVKKNEAERFKEKARAEKETVNAVLARFVREYVGPAEDDQGN